MVTTEKYLLCILENVRLSECYSGYILVPVHDGPFVLVEKFHRFIQQHVLYCIGQAHAGSSLRVYYPHGASMRHCHARSGSRAVTELCTYQDKKILHSADSIRVHRSCSNRNTDLTILLYENYFE